MSWFSRLLGRIKATPRAAMDADSLNVLLDWIKSPTTIDRDLRRHLDRQRREARALAVVNPMARQYLGLLENNVIGPQGIKLQSQVRKGDGTLDKTANGIIEAGWADFWKSPWVDGLMSGIQGEQLLIRTLAVDGEVFVRMVRGFPNKHGFALQMIAADLVDHNLNSPRGAKFEETTNEIRLGIEVDEWGRPVAVWVWNGPAAGDDVTGLGVARSRKRIPAAEMLHLFVPERVGQTRGLTWFNSVIVPLKMLDGYMEAAVTAARAAACQMMIFKHTTPPGHGDKAPKKFTIEATPGGGIALPPGLELQKYDPSHPNADGPGFVKSCQRYISSAWRVSYNALANDLEGVNYSSIRSGLLIERDGWRVLQQMWVDRFRQPVGEAWLACSLLVGGVRLPSRDPAHYTYFRWVPRGWAWVDPLKDVQAAILAVNNLLGSRTSYLAEQGADFEEVLEQLSDEEKQIVLSGVTVTRDAGRPKVSTSSDEDDEDEDMTPAEQAADRKRALALVASHRGEA
jgi:lambda family phage portal protein